MKKFFSWLFFPFIAVLFVCKAFGKSAPTPSVQQKDESLEAESAAAHQDANQLAAEAAELERQAQNATADENWHKKG